VTERRLSAVIGCWLLLCCALAGGTGTTALLTDSATITGQTTASNDAGSASPSAGNSPAPGPTSAGNSPTGPPASAGNSPTGPPASAGNAPVRAPAAGVGNDGTPSTDGTQAFVGTAPSFRARAVGGTAG